MPEHPYSFSKKRKYFKDLYFFFNVSTAFFRCGSSGTMSYSSICSRHKSKEAYVFCWVVVLWKKSGILSLTWASDSLPSAVSSCVYFFAVRLNLLSVFSEYPLTQMLSWSEGHGQSDSVHMSCVIMPVNSVSMSLIVALRMLFVKLPYVLWAASKSQ